MPIENQDSGKRLGNAIESYLNMSRSDIQELTQHEFRDLLRNGFFAKKRYRGRQTEPTDKQMDVLNIHYEKISRRRTTNIKRKYYYKHTTTKGSRIKHYPTNVRRNKNGRWIDTKTGRFVSTKK